MRPKARTGTQATNATPSALSWRSPHAARTGTCTRRCGRVGAAWPGEAFENDVAELHGVRARIVSLRALKADKSEAHDDPLVAAKDRADLAILSRLS